MGAASPQSVSTLTAFRGGKGPRRPHGQDGGGGGQVCRRECNFFSTNDDCRGTNENLESNVAFGGVVGSNLDELDYM